MKNQKRFLVCVLAGLCVMVPARRVFAQQVTETHHILAENEQTTADTMPDDGTSDETEPDDTKPDNAAQNDTTPDDTKPDETGPDDGISGDETQDDSEPDTPAEELPLPEKVTGLHTTCQSHTKVLLEWDDSEGAAYYKVYRSAGGGAYELLGETTLAAYTDKSAPDGATYQYKVIPYNEEKKKGGGAAVRLNRTQAVNIRSQKYSYSQMQTDMMQLSRQYSDYCQLTAIGKSVQGRMIYDFAIGSPNAAESLLVVSTLHAREYICSVVLMRELEYYLSNYN